MLLRVHFNYEYDNCTSSRHCTYYRRKHSDGDSRSQRSDTPLKKVKVEEVSKIKKVKSKKSQNDFPTPSDTVKVKGDAPDRFWASVEPYCADLTETDLKLLQEGIRNVRTCTMHVYIQVMLHTCNSFIRLTLNSSFQLIVRACITIRTCMCTMYTCIIIII